MKARGVGVDKAVDDYETVKAKLGENVDTSGSRFNDAFRIAREENKRQEGNNILSDVYAHNEAWLLGCWNSLHGQDHPLSLAVIML